MNVYLVKPNVKEYQSLAFSDPDSLSLESLTFDCEPKPDWSPPALYVLDPKAPKGDFFYLCPGLLVFSPEVLDKRGFLFEFAGEVLEFDVEDIGKVFGLNVLRYFNALNRGDTVWHATPRGVKTRIIQYSFHSNRFGESPLFKIPETSKIDIFSFSREGAEDTDFVRAYHEQGFQGLEFEEVWRD